MDAALVAALWSYLIARDCGLPSAGLRAILLFCAVWALYLSDRIWDSLRKDPLWRPTLRHEFTSRHRGRLAGLAVVNAVLAFVLAFEVFEKSEWAIAFGLAIICGGYYIVRAVFPNWQKGRAFWVGTIFAAGVMLPVFERGAATQERVVLAFALASLFIANVGMCIRAEAGWVAGNSHGSAIPWCLTAFLLFWVAALGGWNASLLAGMAAAIALAWLDGNKARLEAEPYSALADFILVMSPALALVASMATSI